MEYWSNMMMMMLFWCDKYIVLENVEKLIVDYLSITGGCARLHYKVDSVFSEYLGDIVWFGGFLNFAFVHPLLFYPRSFFFVPLEYRFIRISNSLQALLYDIDFSLDITMGQAFKSILTIIITITVTMMMLYCKFFSLHIMDIFEGFSTFLGVSCIHIAPNNASLSIQLQALSSFERAFSTIHCQFSSIFFYSQYHWWHGSSFVTTIKKMNMK